MSLLPFLLSDYDYCPSRMLGLDYDDLHQPLILMAQLPPRSPHSSFTSNQNTASAVKVDKNQFQANMDVQQFKPEEITVKVNENVVTIEGKHEEKQDQHGFISRHFVRKYVLPKNCNVAKLESRLSSDGVLTITAPNLDQKEDGHRSIPITQTGEPAKQQKQESIETSEKKE